MRSRARTARGCCCCSHRGPAQATIAGTLPRPRRRMAMGSPVDERKLVTVLFADLVDSTAFGAEQDPERTRLTLERFYEAMAAEIEGAGGTVEKFAGDAVMAAF